MTYITISHNISRTQGGLGPCPMRAGWVVRVAGRRASTGNVVESHFGAFLRSPLRRG